MATKKTIKKHASKTKATKKALSKKTASKKTSKKTAAKKKSTAQKTASVKKAVFYIRNEEKKKFVPAEKAKALKLNGFEEYQFFLHRSADGKGWTISEASSGGLIAVGRNLAEAKKNAGEALAKHGKEGLAESIRLSIAKNGTAPGFEAPQTKARPESAPKRKTTSRRSSRPSQLDAAIEILKKAKEALTCKEICRRMLEQKLWETSGRTPGATLSASIQREIAKRGIEARFRKAKRGLYELNV